MSGASLPLGRDPARPAGPGADRLTLRLACYMHSLAGGGVERMRLNLLRQLGTHGVEASLLLHEAAGPLGSELPPGLPVTVFGTSRTLFDLVPLARLLKRERPDALLVSLGHNNIVALAAKLLARSRCTLVVCQHNALSAEVATDRRYRLLPALYRLFAPLADHLVAVSEGVAADMARETGIPRARIEVIHNPVITPDFARRAAEALDDPWFAPGAPPVVVTAGRLVAQKDHETLLRAFALRRQAGPARLLVLGEGPLRGELEALAASLGVAADIRFAGFRANPLPFIRRAEAFVLSSTHEGLGNVLIEALGCGTPVISTDCPHGPAEILDNGRYGVLVPVRDVASLADAMRSPLRTRFPAATLQARAERFSAEAAASRYLALLRAPQPRRTTS